MTKPGGGRAAPIFIPIVMAFQAFWSTAASAIALGWLLSGAQGGTGAFMLVGALLGWWGVALTINLARDMK